jgi:hypothetical protein
MPLQVRNQLEVSLQPAFAEHIPVLRTFVHFREEHFPLAPLTLLRQQTCPASVKCKRELDLEEISTDDGGCDVAGDCAGGGFASPSSCLGSPMHGTAFMEALAMTGAEPNEMFANAVESHGQEESPVPRVLDLERSSARDGPAKYNRQSDDTTAQKRQQRGVSQRERRGTRSRTSHGSGVGRLSRCLPVGIEDDEDFRVVMRLLGPGGARIKRIVEDAGQNVRVSVKGRGAVLEGEPQPAGQNTEALTLWITAQGSEAREGLDRASALAEKLIADVHKEYEAFRQPRSASSAASVSCRGPARRVPMPLKPVCNDDDWMSCRFPVDIAEDKEFRVVRRLLGRRGENVQRIAEEARTAAAAASQVSGWASGKTIVSIRGNGARRSYAANFDGDHEAAEGPLEIVVAAASRPAFDQAVFLVEQLLAGVHQEYRDHCKSRGYPAPQVVICHYALRLN